MTLTQAASALDALEAKLNAYGHAMGLLYYDGETIAPKRSAPGRARTLGVLSGVVHGLLTAPETREMLDALMAHRDQLDRATLRRAELVKD